MSAITRYGTFWGAVPETTGRVFWVAPSSYTVDGKAYSASDNNDGLWPNRALATINQAVTNATADVGDVIMVIGGSYTFTATQTISKAGLRVFGIAGGPHSPHEHGTRTTRYPASLTTSASAAVLTVTAARTEIAFLHLVPASAQAGIDLAADDANIHDCTWNISTAANTATFGISVTGAAARPRISNQYVYVADNQGPFIRCASASAGMDGGMFQRSMVVLAGTTAWDDAVEFTTGVDNFTIRDVDFIGSSGAVYTDVIDVTGNTNDHGVTVIRCIFPVSSDATQETATSDVALASNILAQIQGVSGGTAVV
jgi:hypothetical protein